MASQLERIMQDLLPEWQQHFEAKNNEYGGESANVLGARGQYADMHRKFPKLKRALWDGASLQFESVEEVLMDLIGHCFLTLDMLEQERRNGRA